jgi:hypothetical protein
MSSDLSGEITAIATAVLAFFAIVTAFYARRAFLKQSQEVRDQTSMLSIQSEQLVEQRKINERQTEVLKLQADDLRESLQERQREAADRRRAQAEQVFVGAPHTPGQPVSPYAMNASHLPIFGVQLWSRGVHGLSDPVDLGVILPGNQATATALAFETGDEAMAHTILTFRDTTSRRWVRLPNGSLTKQPCSTTRDSVLAIMQLKHWPAQAPEDTPGG